MRVLGNAIVPQIAEIIGRAIIEAHADASTEGTRQHVAKSTDADVDAGNASALD